MKQILFTGLNKAELVDIPEEALGENSVKVKTVISSISCGTERANITGDLNVGIYGEPEKTAHFPRQSGYSSAGIVVAKGKNVTELEIGDRVAMSWTLHKEFNVIDQSRAVKMPEGMSFNEAALAHIGTFPMAAIRKTRLEIGESCMIMGLGVLGLLAVQFARSAGAVPVIAVDPIKERREKALKFGADFAFDPFEADFAEKVRAVTGGGVNAAIEVTGVGAGFNECLDCMARFGRVALLGCTRDKNFTVDYYRKIHGPGITVIGAHTLARPEFESSPGMFTTRDDVKAILMLCAAKRININGMIEEVHSPLECGNVYDRLINDKKFPNVVQFDWTKM